jgi:hypothetical protein
MQGVFPSNLDTYCLKLYLLYKVRNDPGGMLEDLIDLLSPLRGQGEEEGEENVLEVGCCS